MNHLAAVPDSTTLDTLCALLLAEKAKLEAAKANVLKAEQAIIDAVGAQEEGSFSVACDAYKVTTTQPIRRTVDPMLAKDLMAELPLDLAESIFRWKPELATAVYKQLQEFQPETFLRVTKAVTSKPGKISVRVEALPE